MTVVSMSTGVYLYVYIILMYIYLPVHVTGPAKTRHICTNYTPSVNKLFSVPVCK